MEKTLLCKLGWHYWEISGKLKTCKSCGKRAEHDDAGAYSYGGTG